jgi:hypothetical protein
LAYFLSILYKKQKNYKYMYLDVWPDMQLVDNMSSQYLKCGPGFVGIGLFGCFRSLFLVKHFESVSFFFKLYDFILFSAVSLTDIVISE